MCIYPTVALYSVCVCVCVRIIIIIIIIIITEMDSSDQRGDRQI